MNSTNNQNGNKPADGLRHNQSCSSNFGAMKYDTSCTRCSKISKVIALKRKNVRNGASAEEAKLAAGMVFKLVNQYKLTRGEVFDREYDAEILATMQQMRQKRSKMSQYTRVAPVTLDDLI